MEFVFRAIRDGNVARAKEYLLEAASGWKVPGKPTRAERRHCPHGLGSPTRDVFEHLVSLDCFLNIDEMVEFFDFLVEQGVEPFAHNLRRCIISCIAWRNGFLRPTGRPSIVNPRLSVGGRGVALDVATRFMGYLDTPDGDWDQPDGVDIQWALWRTLHVLDPESSEARGCVSRLLRAMSDSGFDMPDFLLMRAQHLGFKSVVSTMVLSGRREVFEKIAPVEGEPLNVAAIDLMATNGDMATVLLMDSRESLD